MLTINFYTGVWQQALQPKPKSPKKRSLVRISDSPDARELDDFRRCLRESGRGLSHVRRLPRLNMDVYRIVAEEAD